MGSIWFLLLVEWVSEVYRLGARDDGGLVHDVPLLAFLGGAEDGLLLGGDHLSLAPSVQEERFSRGYKLNVVDQNMSSFSIVGQFN